MFPIIYKCSIYFENVMYAIIIPLYIRSITSNCITINIHLSLILSNITAVYQRSFDRYLMGQDTKLF